jgi:hypothetical protein
MDICNPQFVEKNSNNHLKPKHKYETKLDNETLLLL